MTLYKLSAKKKLSWYISAVMKSSPFLEEKFSASLPLSLSHINIYSFLFEHWLVFWTWKIIRWINLWKPWNHKNLKPNPLNMNACGYTYFSLFLKNLFHSTYSSLTWLFISLSVFPPDNDIDKPKDRCAKKTMKSNYSFFSILWEMLWFLQFIHLWLWSDSSWSSYGCWDCKRERRQRSSCWPAHSLCSYGWNHWFLLSGRRLLTSWSQWCWWDIWFHFFNSVYFFGFYICNLFLNLNIITIEY